MAVIKHTLPNDVSAMTITGVLTESSFGVLVHYGCEVEQRRATCLVRWPRNTKSAPPPDGVLFRYELQGGMFLDVIRHGDEVHVVASLR
jgi:hypothetical protein